MSTKISEIEILKEIDKLLEHLLAEERQRIFNFLSSKYTISLGVAAVNSGKILDNKNQSFSTGTTIKQFITAKKPNGFCEQIICLGYFLEKIQGLEIFESKDMTEANTAARVTKIPHTSLYLKSCFAQYGYLVQVGGGKKALCARGEALVEALPDRDAVKAALENNPIKKKLRQERKIKK
ncbi:MAG: hypothetical protein ACTHMV_16000 [Chitinophagaceae bacterium]